MIASRGPLVRSLERSRSDQWRLVENLMCSLTLPYTDTTHTSANQGDYPTYGIENELTLNNILMHIGQTTQRRRPHHTAEFKLHVVRYALAKPAKCRIKPTCRCFASYGLQPVQLRKWIKQLQHVSQDQSHTSRSDAMLLMFLHDATHAALEPNHE